MPWFEVQVPAYAITRYNFRVEARDKRESIQKVLKSIEGGTETTDYAMSQEEYYHDSYEMEDAEECWIVEEEAPDAQTGD